MTGPAGSVTAEDGSRFYTIDNDQFWSVTTALTVVTKRGLTWWAAGLAADWAFAELPRVVAASITAPCGRTHSRCKGGAKGHDWRVTCERCPCARCLDCVRETMRRLHKVRKDERADQGRRLHDWVEQWILTDGAHTLRHADRDIQAYVRAFLAFVQAYGLEPASWLFAEATVINREHRFAGTTDGAIRFRSKASDLAAELVARVLGLRLSEVRRRSAVADVIADLKTRRPLRDGESPKFYPTLALQLAPYRLSPVIRLKGTDEERTMPRLDGALALQLYPDLAVPRLCVSDELTFAAFLNALSLYRWMVEAGTASVSESSFPIAAELVAVKTAPLAKPGQEAPQPFVPWRPDDHDEPPAATVKAPGKRTPRKPTAAKAAQPALAGTGQRKTPPSAIMDSLRGAKSAPHPDSPFGDEIPF